MGAKFGESTLVDEFITHRAPLPSLHVILSLVTKYFLKRTKPNRLLGTVEEKLRKSTLQRPLPTIEWATLVGIIVAFDGNYLSARENMTNFGLMEGHWVTVLPIICVNMEVLVEPLRPHPVNTPAIPLFRLLK